MAENHSYNIEKYKDSRGFRAKVINDALAHHGGMLKWRGGEAILDIGCGPGDITRECFLPLLPKNFKQLVCGDSSVKMLEAAKNEFLGIEHIDYQLINIEKPQENAQKGRFDRIFSTLCFMYIADQRNAFKNILDLLTPGGDCWILQVVSSPLIRPLFEVTESPRWRTKLEHLRETFVFPFWNDPDPIATAETFIKSLGFEDIYIKLDVGYNQLESQRQFEVFMDSLPFFSDVLSKEERKKFLQDQIEIAKTLNIFVNPNDKSIVMKEPYRILIIYGKKPKN